MYSVIDLKELDKEQNRNQNILMPYFYVLNLKQQIYEKHLIFWGVV
jgi:hypothetical protein